MTTTPPPGDPHRSPDPSAAPSWQAPAEGSAADGPAGSAPTPYGSPAPEETRWRAQPGGQQDGPLPQSGQWQSGYGPVVSDPEPGTDLGADIAAAFTFSCNALLRNPVSLLVSGLIYMAVITVVTIIGFVAMVGVLAARAPQWEDPDTFPAGDFLLAYAAMIPVLLLAMVISLLWQSGSLHAATIIAEGGRPTLRQAMIAPGRVIATTLLVGLIVTVGLFLLYIPGIIAAVLLVYAAPAAAKGASPGEAIKQSFALTKAHLGTTIVMVLILAAIGMVAGFLVITVIALIPFTGLFYVAVFERLNGRRLVDPVRADQSR